MTRALAHSPRSPARPGRAGISERKRDAIAEAALRLFLRDGYERTSVDAIAAEAAVSKRTVYNHYGDKENLFLTVVEDTSVSLREKFASVGNLMLADASHVEQSLLDFLRQAVSIVTLSPDGAALVRLVITDAPRFPSLLDSWRRIQPFSLGLAEPLGRLAAEGALDIPDPVEAARHLFALTVGQINTQTLFGTITLSGEEVDRILTGGVRAFLRAYRPADRGPAHGDRVGEARQ